MLLMLISPVSKSEPLISSPTFSRLSTENGLSQDTINSLLLDNEGFLWLGTGEGLNRFDGYQNGLTLHRCQAIKTPHCLEAVS